MSVNQTLEGYLPSSDSSEREDAGRPSGANADLSSSSDLTPAPSDVPDERGLRNAKEVFLYMPKTYHVSRYLRAKWFYEHIGRAVKLDLNKDVTSCDLIVYGAALEDASKDDYIDNEEFLITPKTQISFISQFYRQVYVLDLSPSTLVADEVSGCCLYTLLIDHLKVALTSLVKKIILPGSRVEYRPVIYLSVLVFTPHLSFHEQSVILQGLIITEENVDEVVVLCRKRLNIFVRNLHQFSKPFVQAWHKKKQELQKLVYPTEEISTEPDHTFWLHNRQIDEATILKYQTMGEEYADPETSFIYMIRLGMLGLHLLPEEAESSIILITDAVCAIPDAPALNDLLEELRYLSISCSFMQVNGRSEPSFGHISSCELLHFLAVATFGAYLPNCKCTIMDAPFEHNQINTVQRLLLCWWFEKAFLENKHTHRFISEINNTFAELVKKLVEYY